ncbi:MAG: hypothetical protein R3C69_01915 [Geminicoccaceae bacterium]
MPQLFLRFMMTAEGVEPMTVDGKVSGNEAVPSHPDEPSGVAAFASRLTPHLAATGGEDFDRRQVGRTSGGSTPADVPSRAGRHARPARVSAHGGADPF